MDEFERTLQLIERVGLPTVALIAVFVLMIRGGRWLGELVVLPYVTATIVGYKVLTEGQSRMTDSLKTMQGDIDRIHRILGRRHTDPADYSNGGEP